MGTEAGRARPVLAFGLIAALVLMAVAIAVAVATASPSVADASWTPTPSTMSARRPGVSATPHATQSPTPLPSAPTPQPRPLILPAAIAARPALPSCGHETVNRQPTGDYYDAAAWACFIEARDAGAQAELIRDSLTPEAGRIRDIYRVLADGTIEWFIDASQDPLSGREWTRQTCADLASVGSDPNGTPIYLPRDCDVAEVVITGDALDAPTGDEIAMLERLVLFARSPETQSLDGIPLSSDGVALGLAEHLIVVRSPDELGDPGAWVLAAEAFRGHVGPFSVLDVLGEWQRFADGPSVGEASVSVGSHPHCASPPVEAPPGVAGFRRVSIQPAGIDSCLPWWTVDLYFDAEGAIEAITLDLWEP